MTASLVQPRALFVRESELASRGPPAADYGERDVHHNTAIRSK